MFPPQVAGSGLARLLVALPVSRGEECPSPLCCYILHPDNLYPRGDCYIEHMDPALVDYYQVRFHVACRGWNKGFLNGLDLFLHGHQLLRHKVSDLVMPSDPLDFRVDTLTQYVGQGLIADPAFHVRLRQNIHSHLFACHATPQSQRCQETTGF